MKVAWRASTIIIACLLVGGCLEPRYPVGEKIALASTQGPCKVILERAAEGNVKFFDGEWEDGYYRYTFEAGSARKRTMYGTPQSAEISIEFVERTLNFNDVNPRDAKQNIKRMKVLECRSLMNYGTEAQISLAFFESLQSDSPYAVYRQELSGAVEPACYILDLQDDAIYLCK